MSRLGDALGRFLRWLFGSPVEDLPPEFGDPRPPELRVFEKEIEVRDALQEADREDQAPDSGDVRPGSSPR